MVGTADIKKKLPSRKIQAKLKPPGYLYNRLAWGIWFLVENCIELKLYKTIHRSEKITHVRITLKEI